MNNNTSRGAFLKQASVAGVALGWSGPAAAALVRARMAYRRAIRLASIHSFGCLINSRPMDRHVRSSLTHRQFVEVVFQLPAARLSRDREVMMVNTEEFKHLR